MKVGEEDFFEASEEIYFQASAFLHVSRWVIVAFQVVYQVATSVIQQVIAH